MHTVLGVACHVALMLTLLRKQNNSRFSMENITLHMRFRSLQDHTHIARMQYNSTVACGNIAYTGTLYAIDMKL